MNKSFSDFDKVTIPGSVTGYGEQQGYILDSKLYENSIMSRRYYDVKIINPKFGQDNVISVLEKFIRLVE